VKDPADRVVQGFGGRERLMSTLVGKDPYPSAKAALGKRIKGPQCRSQTLGGNRLGRYKVVKDGKRCGKEKQVSENVIKACGGRSLKAVSWNGVPNLLDGEIWELELVAVAIEQNALGFLVVFHILNRA